MSPWVTVDAGERGVVYNNWNGQLRILGEGTHTRNPFSEEVTHMSVQTQKTEIDSSAASKDLQSVSTRVAVTWHIDSSKIDKAFQEIGDMQALVDKIVTPAINETVKAATAQNTAEELLTKRAGLKATLDASLGTRLATRYLILDDVSIVNVDFSPEFNKAIERKAQAEQDALAEKNKLEQVKFQAQQKIETAKADAESIRIQSAALAENQRLVDWEAVKRWNGVLPQTMLGQTTPFINVNR